MELKIHQLDPNRNLSGHELNWIVQAASSYINNVLPLKSSYSIGGKPLNVPDLFSYYAIPANIGKSNYQTNFVFTQNSLTASALTGCKNANPAAFTSGCRKLGIINYDGKTSLFELTPIAKKFLLNRCLTESEYAIILLSKQWVIKDGLYYRPLLPVLWDVINDKNYKFLIALNTPQNKTLTIQPAYDTIFKYICGSAFNSNRDKVIPDRADILKNALLTAGLVSINSNNCLEVPANASDIWKDLKDNESRFSNPELFGNFYEHLGSIGTGLCEILQDHNLHIYSKLYPNIHKIISKESPSKDFNATRQQIFYGAPGTGKSHGTDGEIKKIYPTKEEEKGKVFRTTFHPDSDYSTFVGCYKPTKNNSQQIVSKNELITKCKEYATRVGYNNQNLTQFGYDYSLSIQKLMKEDTKYTYTELLNSAGVTDTSASSYITAGMDLYSKTASKLATITYDFIAQSFTKAYIAAWKEWLSDSKKPIFLVIEEINRGNCAQIFGDLFQLLDREDDGFSSYPIKPDTDLGNHIAEALNGYSNDKFENIINGEELLLPPNLHIWATMNTSDQSLFPIDSAFKRRWDWKYIKITNAYKKDDNDEYELDADGKKIPLGWAIEFEYEDKDASGNVTKKSVNQDWWLFIQQINKIISSMTSSADKQLGYFFCKAKEGKIDAETFVGKIAFYLWNDVFKDYAMDEGGLFKYKKNANDNDSSDLSFPDFYDEDGGVDTYVVKQFIDNVMLWKDNENKK